MVINKEIKRSDPQNQIEFKLFENKLCYLNNKRNLEYQVPHHGKFSFTHNFLHSLMKLCKIST